MRARYDPIVLLHRAAQMRDFRLVELVARSLQRDQERATRPPPGGVSALVADRVVRAMRDERGSA
jgi:hypothetical protein